MKNVTVNNLDRHIADYQGWVLLGETKAQLVAVIKNRGCFLFSLENMVWIGAQDASSKVSDFGRSFTGVRAAVTQVLAAGGEVFYFTDFVSRLRFIADTTEKMRAVQDSNCSSVKPTSQMLTTKQREKLWDKHSTDGNAYAQAVEDAVFDLLVAASFKASEFVLPMDSVYPAKATGYSTVFFHDGTILKGISVTGNGVKGVNVPDSVYFNELGNPESKILGELTLSLMTFVPIPNQR